MRHKSFAHILNERGSSLVITVWTISLLMIFGISAAYVTENQSVRASNDLNALNALNIAEAAVNEKVEDWSAIGQAGTSEWTDSDLIGITTGTVGHGDDVGTYTLKTTTDTQGSAYKLLTATGTYRGVSKTVTVRVKAVPQAFSYAVATSGELEFEGKDGEPVTIVGNFHTNGDLYIESNDGENFIDLSQAIGTYTGTLTLDPSDLDTGGTFSQAPAIDFPKIDINYYRDQDNWPDVDPDTGEYIQKVWNIDLASPPAYLAQYIHVHHEHEHENEYKIPAEDVDGLWGANAIVNFFWTGDFEEDVEVEFYNDDSSQITLTQTFTGENFEELEFEGNMKLLPLNGQAIIAYNMEQVEIEGGAQVGEIGNGALLYAYGQGPDDECEIELEDGISLYGSIIANLIGTVENPAETEVEGAYIQFDDAFISKLGQGREDQFLDWGTFTLNKIHYDQ